MTIIIETFETICLICENNLNGKLRVWEELIESFLNEYVRLQLMSIRQKRSKNTAPMPSTGAGLMRYFDEELPGRKISARGALIYTAVLIAVVVFLKSTFKSTL